jgi:hypothetical protein
MDTMTDLQHSTRSALRLPNGSGTRLASNPAARKFTAYSLGALMVVAMVTWCGFISWGLISLAQWMLG